MERKNQNESKLMTTQLLIIIIIIINTSASTHTQEWEWREHHTCFLQHTIFMASTCLSICLSVTVGKGTSWTADKHVNFHLINPIFFLPPLDGNRTTWRQAVARQKMILLRVHTMTAADQQHKIVQHAIYCIEKVDQTRIVSSKMRERVDDRKSRIPLQEVVGTRGGTLENFFFVCFFFLKKSS